MAAKLQDATRGTVSTHSRPKAAVIVVIGVGRRIMVSTHSRPKAAESKKKNRRLKNPEFQHTAARRRLNNLFTITGETNCFNTQPPEGGWRDVTRRLCQSLVFQHTAARRRLKIIPNLPIPEGVSTHSRPKAAGKCAVLVFAFTRVSTHSRPKAADTRIGCH